jgi:FkbM family methyltransferase
MIAIDVGANSGVLSTLMREAVGASGRVVAIDPSPVACERVRQQAALNAATNVEVVQAALGATPARGRMYMAEVGIGALPTADRRFATDRDVDVSVTTLDRTAAELRLDRVDLVKIDTDGDEVGLLAGASGTLASHRPALIVESNPAGLARRGHEPQELVAALRDLGYDVWLPIMEERGRLNVRPARLLGFTKCPDVPPEANLVAFHTEDARRESVLK